MNKQKFEVKWDDGKFWLQHEDECGPYEQEVTSWGFADKIAGNSLWSVSVKETTRSRKWKPSSAVTKSIMAHIDGIKEFLKHNHLVMAQTPDIEIIFFKG